MLGKGDVQRISVMGLNIISHQSCAGVVKAFKKTQETQLEHFHKSFSSPVFVGCSVSGSLSADHPEEEKH